LGEEVWAQRVLKEVCEKGKRQAREKTKRTSYNRADKIKRKKIKEGRLKTRGGRVLD